MSDYKKQIAAIKTGIDRLGDDLLAQTSLVVQGEVSKSTPVDTGRARSNWFVGVDAPVRTATEDTTQQNIEDGKSKAQAIKGDSTVYISNNLPYIERLNDGYSQQAPVNFVEGAVQVGTAKAAEIARKGLPTK